MQPQCQCAVSRGGHYVSPPKGSWNGLIVTLLGVGLTLIAIGIAVDESGMQERQPPVAINAVYH